MAWHLVATTDDDTPRQEKTKRTNNKQVVITIKNNRINTEDVLGCGRSYIETDGTARGREACSVGSPASIS